MNNNILRLLDGVNDKDLDKFISSTKGSLNIKEVTTKSVVDYTWIDIIYESIPYLDNIIRNSKSFDKQADNVIFDKIKREVKTEFYEDRFIFSLVKRLSIFLNRKKESIDNDLEKQVESNVVFDAITSYNNKNIRINLQLESVEKDSSKKEDNSNYREKVNYIYNMINNYKNSSYIEKLKNLSVVKSPIRETNIILKDKNYRKALELWEYLDSYENNGPLELSTDIKESKNSKLCNKYILTYYLNYLLLNNYEEDDKKDSKELLKLYISKLIYDYVGDDNVSEREFKNFISKEFKDAKKNKIKRENNLYEYFKAFHSSHENSIKEAFFNIQSDFKVDKENYML